MSVDILDFNRFLSAEERDIRDSVHAFVTAEIMPHIAEWWTDGVFPRELVGRFAALGLLGPTIPEEYGGAGINNVAYGLIMREIERADSGLRSFASVQSGLVMFPIFRYGSQEQKRRYLPELAAGRMVGCFGLTESDGGSDPGAMRTTLKKKRGGGWVLHGSKLWITNGSIADLAIVWAKDEDGKIRGAIVPMDAKGASAPDIQRKFSLRASVTSELVFDSVELADDAILPEAEGLGAPLSCLTQARYGIAWGVIGAAEAVYEEAVAFAKERITFGKPIASRQLVQHKLVEMLTGITYAQHAVLALGRAKDEGQMTHVQVSLLKRANVRMALLAARSAREILGAGGITTDHHAIRHMLNLETVDTYEGTHDIHTLIVGREITGLNALV
jgi:glutaryl-CoA dehydrogenase